MTATSEGRRPATSYDVAARAGVSRSTVSFILNGNGARFPEATRQRVLDAARELEYQPSLAGRSLASGRSDTIVVLLPNTTFGGGLQDAVDEAMKGTMAVGGNVVVRFAGTTPNTTLSAVLALRPAGIIDLGVLSSDELATLQSHGIVTLPERPREPDTGHYDGGIAEIQVSVLAERGLTVLWHAARADARDDVYGPWRYSAMQRACAARGLPAPRQVEVPLTIEGATAALDQVLAGGSPAGVVCYNDEAAVALLAAAREAGVSVPDRIAVVGVDRTPLGQLWSPRLTTVDVDLRGIVGEIAADLRTRLTGGPPAAGRPHSEYLTLVRGETA